MKLTSLLVALIPMSLLLKLPAYAQIKSTGDADYLLGTWIGMTARIVNDTIQPERHSVSWRIHKIDMKKNQLEMTEFYHKLFAHDSNSIERPRKVYSARLVDKSLFIELKDIKIDTTFTLKLSPKMMQEFQTLQNEKGELVIRNEQVVFFLSRINSDTTNFLPKDQRQKITVDVLPPPPIPHKKQ